MAMVVTERDTPNKENVLGQFFTDKDVAEFCINKTPILDGLVVEPSCGRGVFVDLVRSKLPSSNILGIEIDPEVHYKGSEKVLYQNFYDFELPKDVSDLVCFIGNPPFRSPAYSLSERPEFVKCLMKKYHITNMREESVIFLVHTVDLILQSNGTVGYINYILPKAIFDNNSKAYLSFRKFLRKHLCLLGVWDLEKCFEGVNRDLIFVSFKTGEEKEFYTHNGIQSKTSNFYNKLDYIPFQEIFKKTNLGSVPCESIFLSVHNEPLEHFMQRLHKLFVSHVDMSNLRNHLQYNDEYHLASLKRKIAEGQNDKKVEVILGYVEQIKKLPGFDPSLFKDESNYKSIQHRHDERSYFRHRFLKKGTFVYEINRDPCPSFYFPGNPNKGSTDYFGFCKYDVNRNCSPGANRTIPIAGVDENLHDGFKKWWDESSGGLEYSHIFDYIIHISKSSWYKNLKKTCQRFYFGIPKEFDQTFHESI